MTCTMIPIISDTQLPYTHKRAINSMFNWIADNAARISEVHQIGDFYDFTAVSRWVKGTPAENGKTLQKELDAGREFNESLNKCWGGKKTRIMGNHDDRVDNYLSQHAKGLKGLDALSFDVLTEAREYGWITETQPYRIAPGTVSVHGIAVRKYSGYTAHAHLERFNNNVVHGHTHRAGIVYRTIGDKTRWAMECGHLMNTKDASYVMNPDWQMGFGILHVDGTTVAPEFVNVRNDGSFLWGGRKWTP